MKHLIYTCPIAVMWQMKHHKIRFQWRPLGNGFWHDVNFQFLDLNFGEKEYRVHPDDAHLYEPREGDLIQFGASIGYIKRHSLDEENPFEYSINEYVFSDIEKLHQHFDSVIRRDYVNKILMRNNEPWINPSEIREVE